MQHREERGASEHGEGSTLVAGRGLRRAAGPLTEWPCGRRRVHATFPTIDGDKSSRIASRSGEGNAGCGVRGNRDAPLRGPGSVILHDSPASAALSRSCRAGEEALSHPAQKPFAGAQRLGTYFGRTGASARGGGGCAFTCVRTGALGKRELTVSCTLAEPSQGDDA